MQNLNQLTKQILPAQQLEQFHHQCHVQAQLANIDVRIATYHFGEGHQVVQFLLPGPRVKSLSPCEWLDFCLFPGRGVTSPVVFGLRKPPAPGLLLNTRTQTLEIQSLDVHSYRRVQLETVRKQERLQCRSQTISVEIIQTTVQALGHQTFGIAIVKTNARLETDFLGTHFPSKNQKREQKLQRLSGYHSSDALRDVTSRQTNVETI